MQHIQHWLKNYDTIGKPSPLAKAESSPEFRSFEVLISEPPWQHAQELQIFALPGIQQFVLRHGMGVWTSCLEQRFQIVPVMVIIIIIIILFSARLSRQYYPFMMYNNYTKRNRYEQWEGKASTHFYSFPCKQLNNRCPTVEVCPTKLGICQYGTGTGNHLISRQFWDGLSPHKTLWKAMMAAP